MDERHRDAEDDSPAGPESLPDDGLDGGRPLPIGWDALREPALDAYERARGGAVPGTPQTGPEPSPRKPTSK